MALDPDLPPSSKKSELQSALSDNNSAREALAGRLGPLLDSAKDAYSIWKTAEDAPDRGGTFIANGQRFTDKASYVAALQADFSSKDAAYRDGATELNNLIADKDKIEADLKAVDDTTATVKTPSSTNEDKTAAASEQKMANAEIVGDTSASPQDDATGVDAAVQRNQEADAELLRESRRGSTGGLGARGVAPGAQPSAPTAAQVKFKDANGNVKNADLRVKIRVPANYLVTSTRGLKSELSNLGGIIFPYTPSISYEYKADYSTASPMHSNFSLYFYQRSSVGPIQISGKFTVQNDIDAGVYLATVHLLKALTKMRSGGSKGDSDSGAPPPVCRLDAHGEFMLNNIPVVISGFRIELPDSVDYFTLGKGSSTNPTYGLTSVPIVSTIAVTCTPMYSRAEMQKFSVSGWLNDPALKKVGYL